MSSTLPLLFVFGLAGMLVQIRSTRADLLRDRLWGYNYALLIPIAAMYALLSIDIDRRLLELVAVSVTAWWVTVALAGAWARASTRDPRERGAVWQAGAFPNTGFLGFPLAYAAFGSDGLRMAIIYDQVSLVVPAVVLSTAIARTFGEAAGEVAGEASGSASGAPAPSLTRIALASPPLWTVAVLIALRFTVLPEPIELDTLGHVVGLVAGPYGFLLLGLSIPLGGFSHARREVTATLGAVAIRTLASPALLLAVGWAAGVEIPAALLLICAMPTAFHALIIGRVHGLDAHVLRLAIVVSSVLVIGATMVIVVLP